MDDVDAVVIGAGVVGLAVARALAQAGREVLILEAENAFGTGTSSRNSEVIHAGIYYPTGSLRAQLCVRGKQLLYDFCASHGVAHQRCGKLIVASQADELPALDKLLATAQANGVRDLQRLRADEAQALEPALHCVGALLSPSTGIIDSHGLMLALLGDAEAAGAMLALCAPVLGGRCTAAGLELDVGGDEPMQLRARTVVNSAGLQAPALARRFAGLAPAHVPRDHLAKGCYFTPARARAVLAPGLPGAGPEQPPGRAPDAGPGRPGPLRPQLRMGGRHRLHGRPGRRRRTSTPRCGATGPACPTACCSRAMPACGRRSAARASRRPISASTGRRSMACPGWSTCSASSRPG